VIAGELTAETATLGLGIGLVFALLCYLTTNLSPGGMISPGWLAIAYLQDWLQAALIVGSTFAAFGLIVLIQRLVILYGKRLFAAVLLLSVLLQLSLFLLIQREVPLLFSHQTLGFVVPGLVAYQLVRQPPVATLTATGVVSVATYLVLISGVIVGVVAPT
jgi:poly-gamma-glutamate biosynthesis protein PgsC/CapC